MLNVYFRTGAKILKQPLVIQPGISSKPTSEAAEFPVRHEGEASGMLGLLPGEEEWLCNTVIAMFRLGSSVIVTLKLDIFFKKCV
jgi:hypothetical protein